MLPAVAHARARSPSCSNSHPVTLNGGMRMPAWYDIVSLTDRGVEEDRLGMERTAAYITSLIDEQVQAGIPASRIVLGGFSQGGMCTLFTALTTRFKLGGLVVLSGYMPLYRTDFATAPPAARNLETPLFMAHGRDDPVVRFDYGEMSAKHLSTAVGMTNVTFKAYSGLAHSASDEELADVGRFLRGILYQ